MNIGVIGTGNIGEVIIRKLRDVGYPVKMAHARGPESLNRSSSFLSLCFICTIWTLYRLGFRLNRAPRFLPVAETETEWGNEMTS